MKSETVREGSHTNKTHTQTHQGYSVGYSGKKNDWLSNQSVRPLNAIIWVPQMASRGDVSLQSWSEAFEVFSSLSIKHCHQHPQWVSPIPSLSSLVRIQLHNCSCYVCYKDLSSPVRAALMHTIAHHSQSDSLVLLGHKLFNTRSSNSATLESGTFEQVIYVTRH